MVRSFDNESNLDTSKISKPIKSDEFICIRDYKALSKTELNLKKNSRVLVLEKSLNGWWFVDAGHEGQGYVPQCILIPLNGSFVHNKPIKPDKSKSLIK